MEGPILRRVAVVAAVALALAGSAAHADVALRGPAITATRISTPITVDGDLSDEAWKNATRVDGWYETNPGDNVPPKAKTVGWLAYDDKYLYAGFEFDDPDPAKIRAPFVDRDNVNSSTDYGGVILDPRNDGKTGYLFLANPRGIQYDAINDDASGTEDNAPDFFWDCSAKMNDHGWTLEIRIPFSSLRYADRDEQTWGVMFYRNWPRDYRYQMFSTRLPRDGSCFICYANTLAGLRGLPKGGGWVVAPYASGSRRETPEAGLGTPLRAQGTDSTGGIDAKWSPNATTSLDATINPDFSQIESDVAQLTTNERFALFYPEKRPFFLEGSELLLTPIQAVYTRTITSPSWGARATGRVGETSYTALVARDDGGGSVIIPGPQDSGFADQDFKSLVGIARVRHDHGKAFLSFLATVRDPEGRGSNAVAGPDFQWRPTPADNVTGQLLVSRTETPVLPSLATEWDGRTMTSHAGDLWWAHVTDRLDTFLETKDFGDAFRADLGFVPQAGFREHYGEIGHTSRPTGFFRRIRTFFITDYTQDTSGRLLSTYVSPGAGMDGRWNSFGRFRLEKNRLRVGDSVLERKRFLWTFRASPSLAFTSLETEGDAGEQIDFANARPAHGARVSLAATVRPSNHLELRANGERRWIDVAPASGVPGGRLFTATLERLRATYTFNARCFARIVGQRVGVTRRPDLYTFAVDAKEGSFTGSALFAYKLNWQSVLFVGYGDDRELDDVDRWRRADRQVFVKLSYAFQR